MMVAQQLGQPAGCSLPILGHEQNKLHLVSWLAWKQRRGQLSESRPASKPSGQQDILLSFVVGKLPFVANIIGSKLVSPNRWANFVWQVNSSGIRFQSA